MSDYDVMPMVLPSINTDDVNKCMNCSDENNEYSYTNGEMTIGHEGGKSKCHTTSYIVYIMRKCD